MQVTRVLLLVAACCAMVVTSAYCQGKIGLFDNSSDVGAVRSKGAVSYDPKLEQYEVAGSGENVWGTKDEFQYVWKQMKGDFIVQARGKFVGEGIDPHRKMGWMVRSALDTDAPMAAAAAHGDGLASLQFRKTKGGEVEEVKSSASAPDVIQLERKGDKYILSVARFGDPFNSVEMEGIALGEAVYVGLFVSAHNKDAVEKAVFNNVRITIPAREDLEPYREYIGSNIEILDVTTGDRKIVHAEPGSLQAPNWTTDNKALIYNSSQGLMYRFDLEKKTASQLNTGKVTANNNDHVISFDGKMLGLSSSSGDPEYGSLVYTVPIQGGNPKQVTPVGPSYLHGWSPDEKYLVYTGLRNKEYDIYRIPSSGGKEVRLTTAPGLDDGSEYSPDGKYIYFNSVRTGTMQLWRMNPDGSNQEQLTFDEYNNWFPHISPDGKWIVFLSYMPDVPAGDHPFYKHVYLRLMPVNGDQKPKVIAYFYGGQGSINTPSWSPDSKKVAFISNSDMSGK